MYSGIFRNFVVLTGATVLIWLTFRVFLPVGAPFLLGAALALAAEPAVRLLSGRLRLPRFAATGIGVSLVFALSVTTLTVAAGLLVRQLSKLSAILPQLEQAMTQGSALLQNWLTSVVEKLPGSIPAVIMPAIENLFSGGSGMLEQAAMQLPRLATGLLGSISEGMLGVLTGIISGYMISTRLPALRLWIRERLPAKAYEKILPALRGFRKALGGWILAELKLAGIAFALLAVGFWLLRVSHGLLWAGLVTLVDAFPILGVGTVLVPWSLVCLLQGDTARGIGLLGLYAVIWLIRSVLEPKLVGKGLGIDPLVTLIAIYAGFRLWGIVGMLLAPILALAVSQVIRRINGGAAPYTDDAKP